MQGVGVVHQQKLSGFACILAMTADKLISWGKLK
jgi:hypothetical protein